MAPQRQLFGTDGIRGVAGEFPLDKRTVFAIGSALGHRLAAAGKHKRAVIGQDTRESSHWIANIIASGLMSAGIQVESAGVLPLPALRIWLAATASPPVSWSLPPITPGWTMALRFFLPMATNCRT